VRAALAALSLVACHHHPTVWYAPAFHESRHWTFVAPDARGPEIPRLWVRDGEAVSWTCANPVGDGRGIGILLEVDAGTRWDEVPDRLLCRIPGRSVWFDVERHLDVEAPPDLVKEELPPCEPKPGFAALRTEADHHAGDTLTVPPLAEGERYRDHAFQAQYEVSVTRAPDGRDGVDVVVRLLRARPVGEEDLWLDLEVTQ
jgi:hypothetical protein